MFSATWTDACCTAADIDITTPVQVKVGSVGQHGRIVDNRDDKLAGVLCIAHRLHGPRRLPCRRLHVPVLMG
eukprot:NODE_26177_length_561_cov_2.608295.p2 GENE.NODE_26177_length_561_cov_2.608295~~NODE_26177_length_561_cov_2.608295.p2  ORF type:complete len:72 (+),score=7.63 NODE_26177_length_561_cov_2.608295:271-486(+)